MYGSAQALEVNEEAPLAPATEYARSKVLAEEALRTLAAPGFSPVYIRNGTVYGVSPRMRFDTVLNDFVGQAVTSGKVVVFSNGEPWRPVVHVEDVSRTFLLYLEAPTDVIHNQAFNNGAASLNYRVRELAEIVVRTVPGATLEIRGEAGADQRTYKANFDKFARTFPSFKFKWNAENGARELYESLKNLGVDTAIFRSDRFTRLKWLDHLLKSQTLDDNLRWRTSAEAII
jgi:nucleoside-diphosphate-sugar epimerase